MKRLDAWLTDDCFAAHLIGHLHSTFSSVLNIKFGDRIITFSQEGGFRTALLQTERFYRSCVIYLSMK